MPCECAERPMLAALSDSAAGAGCSSTPVQGAALATLCRLAGCPPCSGWESLCPCGWDAAGASWLCGSASGAAMLRRLRLLLVLGSPCGGWRGA